MCQVDANATIADAIPDLTLVAVRRLLPFTLEGVRRRRRVAALPVLGAVVSVPIVLRGDLGHAVVAVRHAVHGAGEDGVDVVGVGLVARSRLTVRVGIYTIALAQE